ncbi:major capsid protein E [Vibrio phage 1.084.O._10N.261.49.F5]|nr:major capsid protein E [Vibrio phage 1.084.O._10N.261.49.F5]
MTIKSQGYAFLDFSELTELMPRIPKLLGELGIFREADYHASTLIEVERVSDGIDDIQAQARGGDRNYSGGEEAIQRQVKIPFFPLDTKKFSAVDIQDMKDFVNDPNIPMTMQKRMDRARDRLARSHAVLRERARYKALKGVSYSPNQPASQYNYADLFSVTAKVAPQLAVNFADLDTDPRTTIEQGARQHIQKYAGDQADGYKVIAICGSKFFDGLKDHVLVREAYSRYSSDSEPLRRRLGGEMINRSWETEGVTYIEDFMGQVIGEIATDEVYFLPMGIADMFQEHFAPADHDDYANKAAQEMYLFVEEYGRTKQVQSETSFLQVNTRPELVVNGKGTFA